jgi:thiol-disulfide isomerase/thioredoxin
MTHPRQLLLVALSLFIVLSGFTAPAQSRAKRAGKTSAAVRRIAVRQIDVDGLRALLKRDNSRPLAVNFWATWCDPCREEFPDLVKINAEYGPKGLDFITITLDDLKDIKTEVPKFLREMRAPMPTYLLNVSDPEPSIKLVDTEWGGALPATFLYNQKGEIVFKHFGRVKPEELRAAIEKVVSSKQEPVSGKQ